MKEFKKLNKRVKFKRDLYKRLLFKDNEIKIKIYKYLCKQQLFFNILGLFFYKFNNWLKTSVFFSLTNNRCLLNNKIRGVYRLSRLNRMSVKILLKTGNLTGVKRSLF